MTYSCSRWVLQTCCFFPGQAQAWHVVVLLALILLSVHLSIRRLVEAYTAEIDERADLRRCFDGRHQRFRRVDAGVPNILLETGRPASRRIQHILTRGIHHRVYSAWYAILFELVPGDAFCTGHARYNGYFISVLGQVLGQVTANETGAAACQREPLLARVFTQRAPI